MVISLFIDNVNADITALMKILSSVWRLITAIKNALGNLLFVFLVVVIVVAISFRDEVEINDRSALVLNPKGFIVEQFTAVNPLEDLMSGYRQQETMLRDILNALTIARDDPQITALVLDLTELEGAGMGHLEEIGNALKDFKISEKPVYAFGPAYTQTQYLIAVHADHVVLDQDSFQTIGGVFLTGLGVYPTYFKSALDNLKVDIRVFSVGDYKAAVEPYLRNGMSDYAKEANAEWLKVLWDSYTQTVIDQRGITRESLEQYTNSYGELLATSLNDPAKLAKDRGLVDRILSKSEWRQLLLQAVEKSDETFRQVDLRSYVAAKSPARFVENSNSDKIAVITASGTILDGEQPAGFVGGNSIVELIDQARKDRGIKGIVVRVNSPGGSAAASEQIRHALARYQQTGNPVVVSMGSYAASGGYWIASTANKIYAMESTVTGSIGTFMLFPTFQHTLAEIGVYSDGVGTTQLSGALNPLKDINPILQRTLEQTVDLTYRRFTSLVARGRDMSVEDVEKIAQGRVWAGATALKLGLVDAIGGLDAAIASTAVLSDLSEYEVVYLEKELSPQQQIISRFINTGVMFIHSAYPPISTRFDPLTFLPKELVSLINMSKTPGVYLQCLYCSVR